jgi:hypothetical protein
MLFKVMHNSDNDLKIRLFEFKISYMYVLFSSDISHVCFICHCKSMFEISWENFDKENKIVKVKIKRGIKRHESVSKV